MGRVIQGDNNESHNTEWCCGQEDSDQTFREDASRSSKQDPARRGEGREKPEV